MKYHYVIVLPHSVVSGFDTPEEIAHIAAHHAKTRQIEVYIATFGAHNEPPKNTLAYTSPGIY